MKLAAITVSVLAASPALAASVTAEDVLST